MDFDKLNSVLLDAVLRRVGLNELYAGVSTCTGLPLICFDTSFRLVAHAFKRPFYFNHWEDIVQHGGADEDAVLGNNYLVDQEKMYKNRKSLCFDSGNSSGYPQACGPVLIGDRLVAYCGIMIEDCDVEDALRANDLLAEATAVLLRETSLDVGQPELAEKLLIENELGGEAARKFASAFPPPYAFIMISVQDSGVSTLEYIRGILCAPGKQRIGCRGAEKQLYMLQYDLARGEDFSELQSITGSYGLACGVSDTFSDLAEISERRAQAMLSLTVGSGGFSTFRGSYAEIAECCAAEFYGPYASKLRSIEELAGDDQAVDSDYVKTLECYLRSFKRHSAVSEKLGLHRNTVINRIKRIEGILNMDISAGGSLSKLLLGIDMHGLSAGDGEAEYVR
ncbi:MAG: helix-turn-helix domain-containing protein [Oscillospiraceae bacterium]|nr:helix-turn-helix domain-containing protein [Oscillospiraceae bacterium]